MNNSQASASDSASSSATPRSREDLIRHGREVNLEEAYDNLPAEMANAQDIEEVDNMGSSDSSKFPFTQKQIATAIKYTISSCLTIMYVAFLLWGIWTGEAVLPGVPIGHFIILVFCLTLIFYLEGLQVAILAVIHLDIEDKKDSHPRGYKLMKSVKEGHNVDRFLVGRQFFTIFAMTLMAQVTTFPGISHLGANSVIWFILIQTGLPGAVVATTIGSLQPQLLAAKDPFRFMDMYGANVVLNMCYTLEQSGICTHFAWMLITILRNTFFKTENKPLSHGKEMTMTEQVLDVVRYVSSFGVIGCALTFIMYGIWTGEAVIPLPPVVVFLLFICSGVFLALMEGLQVAILVMENKDPEVYAESHPRAYALMKRATYEKNVRRFLIGRQFFVIFVVFLMNQCSIFPNIGHFGISQWVFFVLFQLGLPTALTALCWCQLPAQLLANLDGLLFMNRIGPRTVLEVCLYTEMTGVAHFSWVVSSISRRTWFQCDEVALKEVEKYKKIGKDMNSSYPTESVSRSEREARSEVASSV